MALASILLLALYGSFFSIISSASKAEENLSMYLDAGRFLDTFTREVRAAYYKAENPYTFFAGEKRGLNSVVGFTLYSYPIIKEGSPASDLMAVRYSAEGSKEGYTLYKEIWNPYIGERFKAGAVEGVKGFDVSFYTGKAWSKAWDSGLEKAAPVAIKANIRLKDNKTLSAVARVKMR